MKLTFGKDEKDKIHFEFIYQGVMLGGHLVTQKGTAVLRREISVLEKLETISEEYPCGKKVPNTEESDRFLKEDGGEIDINDKEFDLIIAYMETVPWSIGKAGRRALETMDWIKSCAR